MTVKDITEQINTYKKNGQKLFLSSSFQTHSVVLLHIISRIDNSIPIYFSQTGYHFPETIEYKDTISEKFNLKVLNLRSFITKQLQRDSDGRMLFIVNPDQCWSK